MMRIVIVGGGQSGAWVARTARSLISDARIVLVGEEKEAPYERPSLSKQVLAGTETEPHFVLTRAQAQALDIELRLGSIVASVDRPNRRIVLQDGQMLSYDRLVLATGGAARLPEIPGVGSEGVHTLRTWQDACRLRERLATAGRLLVLGGGWIGLEAAAAARARGIEVVLIEGADRLCRRSVPPSISQYLCDLHRRHGVDVQTQGRLEWIAPSSTGTLVAMTHRGREVFDVIVIGIGLKPNTALAAACGLEVDDGIVVDEQGRTSDPAIYATGDVARQPSFWPGADAATRVRLESWANAQNHGIRVGRSLAGGEVEPMDPPWFWSDQYQASLQVLGTPVPTAQTVWRRHPGGDAFCLFSLRADGLLQAVISVGMPREIKLAKRWMKAGICPSPEQLADPDFRLDRFKGEAQPA